MLSAEDEAALEEEYNQLLEASALETGQELPSAPTAAPVGSGVAQPAAVKQQKQALLAE